MKVSPIFAIILVFCLILIQATPVKCMPVVPYSGNNENAQHDFGTHQGLNHGHHSARLLQKPTKAHQSSTPGTRVSNPVAPDHSKGWFTIYVFTKLGEWVVKKL